MRLDKMTPEQRARFEAHCAQQRARSKFALPITCMFCDELIVDVRDPSGQKQLPTDAVVIPFFGYFCKQTCANAFERDYGIRFKRDATGKVSYA